MDIFAVQGCMKSNISRMLCATNVATYGIEMFCNMLHNLGLFLVQVYKACKFGKMFTIREFEDKINPNINCRQEFYAFLQLIGLIFWSEYKFNLCPGSAILIDVSSNFFKWSDIHHFSVEGFQCLCRSIYSCCAQTMVTVRGLSGSWIFVIPFYSMFPAKPKKEYLIITNNSNSN